MVKAILKGDNFEVYKTNRVACCSSCSSDKKLKKMEKRLRYRSWLYHLHCGVKKMGQDLKMSKKYAKHWGDITEERNKDLKLVLSKYGDEIVMEEL